MKPSTSIESNTSNEAPRIVFSFGKCKICDDIATGIHYGIATCEGCKGFYKRSLKKHESYFCFQKNNCLINKITRNRCKACRFKKCLKEGMSIDGIRMGRIPKSEKLKSASNDNDKDCDSQMDTSDNSATKNQLVPHKAEFRQWLTNQIEFIKNDDIIELNALSKKNTCISLSLNLNKKINRNQTGIQSISLLKQHKLFESSNTLPNTIHSDENDIFLNAILKDKVFQLYKKHLTHSSLINSTTERLKSKDYIDFNDQNITVKEVWSGLMGMISEHTKWLTRFAKDLPGFSDLTEEDFTAMVFSSTLLLYEIQINRFVSSQENYTILTNRIQMSRTRMIQLFGLFLTELVFEFHSRFKNFELSDYEMSLFYPFVLCSCNENLIKEKEKCYQLKANYTQALVYVFELHGRNELFMEELQKFFEVTTVLEMNREKVTPNQK